MRDGFARRARSIRQLGVALAWLALAAAVSAHHSFAMFDPAKQVEIAGTVFDFQFTNPHTYFEVDVPQPRGGTTRYTLEGPTPAILKRLGWNRSTLKRGDKVTFVIHPLRDGRPGGQARRVTLPDGKMLSTVNEDTQYVK